MRKPCIDKQCRRAGEELPLTEFYKKSDARDRRDVYCKECRTRRVRANLASPMRKRQRQVMPDRKPLVITMKAHAFSLVYAEIQKGPKTREQIHAATKLDYDVMGEALVELVWECKAVKIEGREFVLTDPDIRLAAA